MQREISWRVAVLCLGQAILFIAAMMLCVLARSGWTPVAFMAVAGGTAIWVSICGCATRRSLAVGWGASLLAWGFLAWGKQLAYTMKADHLVVVGLVMTGILSASARIDERGRKENWRLLGLAWGLAASVTWLVGGYLRDRYYGFLFAVGAIVVLLVAMRLMVRLPGFAIQVVHTLLLFLVGLPLVDAFTRPSYKLDNRAETVRHYYSFEAAQEDPGAFAWWWQYFMGQWTVLHKAIATTDPSGTLRYKLRPNSEVQVFESRVKINSLGFRGPEIEAEKGEAYRIMALGESTTFGCTITKDGKPWPRVLEKLLVERLHPAVPVQVINAGVYGFTLEENVRRLKKRLLALKPDMIISYHGYNFFNALNKAVPPAQGEPPPVYEERPLKLLADLEYQLQIRFYRWQRGTTAKASAPAEADPMETRYAEAYEELIRLADKNDVQLVLANYSMAVNAESDPAVVEFYRAGFPEVRASILANELHSEIVAHLAEEHPEVQPVDTHPPLDGKHEYFIDLVHFTQPGRKHMAETFYEAIWDIVAKETGGIKTGDDEPMLKTEDPKAVKLEQEA